MKKKIGILLLLSLMVFTLGACAGKGETKVDGKASASDEESYTSKYFEKGKKTGMTIEGSMDIEDREDQKSVDFNIQTKGEYQYVNIDMKNGLQITTIKNQEDGCYIMAPKAGQVAYHCKDSQMPDDVDDGAGIMKIIDQGNSKNYIKSRETIDGIDCQVETFGGGSEPVFMFCYNTKGELCFIIISGADDGHIETLKLSINSVTMEADESKFQIPEGYVIKEASERMDIIDD